MDLRHLRTFIALAEELHFGRAASRLHTAQPGVSRTLREMEDELGTVLLDRRSRRIVLTVAGRAFLAHARQSLASLESGIRAARSGTEDGIEHLRMGLMLGAHQPFVGEILVRFAARNPAAQISLHQVDERDLGEAFAAGRIDIAVGWDDTIPTGLHRLAIGRATVQAFLPEGHPLSGRDRIAWSDLGGLPVVIQARDRHPILIERYRQTVSAHGHAPNVIVDVATNADMILLVAAGLGIGTSPSTPGLHHPGVVIVEPQPPVELGFDLAWSTTSPTVSALLACVEGAEGDPLAVVSRGS